MLTSVCVVAVTWYPQDSIDHLIFQVTWLFLIQEIVTNQQVQIANDTSIEEQTPATATETVDPWDADLIDTEDSEEDASEDSILPERKQVTEYIKEKRLPLS